eukprot:TRINITY_DN38248_c0_g2_i1.p1 TRINITY_DN38248_c0_g2~~TRINITY_DN38248_c0_g2_i1.p1  ORF type:complete len:497 (+),score=72.48 TRINITY_DN38248_c0_g2_i1:202-1491(+)
MEAPAGSQAIATCPEDSVYVGPAIECGLVNRVCLGNPSEPVDTDYCWPLYNYTVFGESLDEWPEDLEPLFIKPEDAVSQASINQALEEAKSASVSGMSHVQNDRNLFGLNSIAESLGIGSGSLRANVPENLPQVVTPSSLHCTMETYADLEIGGCSIKPETFTQNGPGQGVEFLRFRAVAVVNDRVVDLVVANVEGYIPANSTRNGKVGSMGQINIAAGETITLRFQVVNTDTNELVAVDKMYFTLFNTYGGPSGNSDVGARTILADGISEYFVDTFSSISSEVLSADRVAFSTKPRHMATSEVGDPMSQLLNEFADMVVLTLRKTSSFDLTFSVVADAEGWDFQFFGWSQLVTFGDRTSPSAESSNTSTRTVIARNSATGPAWASSWRLVAFCLSAVFLSFIGVSGIVVSIRRCRKNARRYRRLGQED